jgi:hypothetical protein
MAIAGIAWPGSAATGGPPKGEAAKVGAVFVSLDEDFAADVGRSIESCYMLPSNPNAGAFRQCDQWDRKHRHWGGHQVAFYGNLKPAIQDLAALIGFEVVDGR